MKKAKVVYASRGISPDVKQFAAEFIVALLAQNIPLEVILVCLALTFYSPSKRTIYEHIALIKAGKEVASNTCASGCRSSSPTRNGRL